MSSVVLFRGGVGAEYTDECDSKCCGFGNCELDERGADGGAEYGAVYIYGLL